MIGLPNFPSYTSGHSTFSAAAAAVLSYLFPSGTRPFNADRDEAALSRFNGGIHYPSDINVGKEYGEGARHANWRLYDPFRGTGRS